jgi:hypothetical protein
MECLGSAGIGVKPFGDKEYSALRAGIFMEEVFHAE